MNTGENLREFRAPMYLGTVVLGLACVVQTMNMAEAREASSGPASQSLTTIPSPADRAAALNPDATWTRAS